MRNVAVRIANNSIFMAVARISEFLSGIITTVVVARYLGLEGFGEYAFIRAIGFVIAPVVAFGSASILIREISVRKEDAAVLVVTGLILNILMSIAAAVIAALIAVVFGLTSKVLIFALCLTLLSQAFLVMTKTVGCVFIAYETMVHNLAVVLFSRALAVVSVIIVVRFHLGFMSIFAALALGSTGGLILALLILIRLYAKPHFRSSGRHLTHLLKDSLPLAGATFLAQGNTYINVFLLKIFHSITEVSLFQAPLRIIQPLFIATRALLISIVPPLSRLASDIDSHPQVRYMYQKLIKYIFVFTLPFCICSTVFAREIITLLFTEDFSPASAAFRILIWAIVPLFANASADILLTTLRRQNVLMISNAVCLVTNCVLGLTLVRQYGYLGASWASLFSYISLLLTNFYFVSKHLGIVGIHRIAFRPVIAGVIMWISLSFLANKVNVIYASIVASLIYSVVLFLFNTFPTDERTLFKQVIFGVPQGRSYPRDEAS